MKQSRSILRRRRPEEATTRPEDVQDSITAGVQEHRQSMVFRPKSAGDPEHRRSLSRLQTSRTPHTVHTELDMAFIEGPVMEIKAGVDTFHFPTPRSAGSPASASPLKHYSARESPQIGVALGSPSQAASSWTRLYPADRVAQSSHGHLPADRRAQSSHDHLPASDRLLSTLPEHGEADPFRHRHDSVKKKKTGWKAFGNLFRSKSARQVMPETSYELRFKPDCAEPTHYSPQVRAQARFANYLPSPMGSPSTTARPDAQSPTQTRGQARAEARKRADRASLVHQIDTRRFQSPSQNSRNSLSVQRDDVLTGVHAYRPEELRHDSPLSTDPPKIDFAIPRTPRLDLEFPAPEMERYSVMFRTVLDEEPRPGLLERRQSRLKRGSERPDIGTLVFDGMQPANVQSANIPQRSMSVLAPRSPDLRIQAHDRENQKVPRDAPAAAFHRPRPLRSFTAPVKQVAPMAAMSANIGTIRTPMSVIEEASSIPSPNETDKSLPPTPATILTARSSLTLNTLVSPREPEWEMITAQHQTSIPSSRQRLTPFPQIKSAAELEQQIVQVSVARQVSVSRARGRVERALASREWATPLKPRVVEMRRSQSARRSTVGVLEGCSG